GVNSMLSIGAVATTRDKELSDFYRKIQPLKDLQADRATMVWWKTQPNAWEELGKDQQPAQIVVNDFKKWIRQQHAQPIFVSAPIALDYPFISWYFKKFIGDNPFEERKEDEGKLIFHTLDLPSLTSGVLGKPLKDSTRHSLAAEWFGDVPHSHKAIDDARGYGHLLRKLLALSKS
ncbi:MAG: 3'-5' exoribonuclease, partial [Candidatus Saccharimonadales bacterium]|nr:3'-5' exoribonuclease [Candidatus Saccharimonadales bacterium]